MGQEQPVWALVSGTSAGPPGSQTSLQRLLGRVGNRSRQGRSAGDHHRKGPQELDIDLTPDNQDAYMRHSSTLAGPTSVLPP